MIAIQTDSVVRWKNDVTVHTDHPVATYTDTEMDSSTTSDSSTTIDVGTNRAIVSTSIAVTHNEPRETVTAAVQMDPVDGKTIEIQTQNESTVDTALDVLNMFALSANGALTFVYTVSFRT